LLKLDISLNSASFSPQESPQCRFQWWI